MIFDQEQRIMKNPFHSPIQEQTNANKGNLVIAIALLTAWAVVAVHSQLEEVNKLAGENTLMATEYVVWLTNIVAFGFSLAVLALGAWILWIGHRACRYGSFPPPGTHLIRNAHFYAGRKAKIIGWVSQAAGILILLFGTTTTWMFVQLAQYLIRH